MYAVVGEKDGGCVQTVQTTINVFWSRYIGSSCGGSVVVAYVDGDTERPCEILLASVMVLTVVVVRKEGDSVDGDTERPCEI
jgi:hypothetical protein